MCLETLDNTVIASLPYCGTYYKVVKKYMLSDELYGPRWVGSANGLNIPQTRYGLGTVHAENTDELLPLCNCYGQVLHTGEYSRGFHAYRNLADAREECPRSSILEYKIIRVRMYRCDITAVGVQECKRVVVANRMRVLGEVK